MNPSSIELLATGLFAAAVLHTFLSSALKGIAHRYPEGSVGENFFHLVGEVEVVFGLWAGVLALGMVALAGTVETVAYIEALNFTEPLFVFAIMAVAATRPIVLAARALIAGIARTLPLPGETAAYLACLVVGPLLGSFITEPAAMTVTALLLKDRYYQRGVSARFMYVTLAALFVNVSIGGVLTPFAAPPVLMVAGKWGWDIDFMLREFGWKAALAVVTNAAAAVIFLRGELNALRPPERDRDTRRAPLGLAVVHLVFLSFIVMNAHHPAIFLGAFLFFLGVATITREYQDELKLRESLLVAFFLAGLVVFGGLQKWWLDPVLRSLNELPLFLGATGLTAITDNAALTYLGSQVEGISDSFKYALVAGAVAGGGLTVIANAPNPAGFAILQESFGEEGINPAKLLVAAAVPTLVAMGCFWLLP